MTERKVRTVIATPAKALQRRSPAGDQAPHDETRALQVRGRDCDEEKKGGSKKKHQGVILATDLLDRGTQDGGGEPADSPPEQKSAKDVHAQLMHEVCRNLTNDKKEGWVYLIRSSNLDNAELVKIGITNNLKRRKQQLKTRCGLRAETIHLRGPIDSIRRIESLAKIDLLHLKQPWNCKECSEEHGEWFKVDKEQAIRTVDTWVNWLAQKPYVDSEIKPLWRFLVEKARKPADMFDHDDHKGRRRHWEGAVREPTQEEEQAFREQDMQLVLRDQRGDDEKEPGKMPDWKGMEALRSILGSGQITNAGVNINVQINNCTFNIGGSSKRREG